MSSKNWIVPKNCIFLVPVHLKFYVCTLSFTWNNMPVHRIYVSVHLKQSACTPTTRFLYTYSQIPVHLQYTEGKCLYTISTEYIHCLYDVR